MALQVWLPLNGNTSNQGLLGNLTTTGNITYKDGIYGKSINTGGLTMTAEQTASVLNNDAVSIAFWIYVNTDTGSTDYPTKRDILFGNDSMTANNNRKFSLYQYPSCNDLHWSWMNDTANATFSTDYLSGVLPSYKWTHVAVTYKKGTFNIYINGVLKKTGSCVSNSSSFAYETNVIHDNTCHMFNDYRIYDSYLSAKEVKELSKGLCLHLPLNQPEKSKNLVVNGKCNNIMSSRAGSSEWSYSFDNDENCSKYTCTTTGTCGVHDGAKFPKSTDKIGKTYTWSIDIRANRDLLIYELGHECGGTIKDITLSTEWKRYSNTWKFTDATYTAFIVYPGTNAKVDDWIEVKNYKIEEGVSATSYTPNTSESIYTELGYSENIESDISGFNNHGTINNMPTISEKSPMYDLGYHIENVKIISGNTGFPVGTNPNYTVNFWFKPTKTSGYTQFADVLGWIASGGRGGNFRFESSRTVGNVWNYFGNTLSDGGIDHTVIVPSDGWNMMTFTSDGTTQKAYKNGVLYATNTIADSYKNYALTGSWYIGDAGMYADISDFRVYCTALSDGDIMELYNAPVSISDTGTLITKGEFKEE